MTTPPRFARTIIFLLLSLSLAAQAQDAQAYTGRWQGAIEVPGSPLGVEVQLLFEGGRWQGTIDIPAQGSAGLPLENIALEGDAFTFAIAGVPGAPTFTGRLVGESLQGDFSQGGQTLPFTLERTGEALSLRRPQDPLPPFPYREEEVRYPSGDITLAGTLTLPEGNGPFPALLLLSGSGPQDRNEELFGHRPFLVIADALTRAGFAVLRADDRGVGASEGDFDAASFEDFAEDALAGLHYLTSHPEVDAARVGLLGHSEGGFIAPVVASASAEVAFLITLAGPSVRGAEVLELQNKLLFEQAGATEAQVEAQLAYLRELAALIEAGDTEAAKARTRARMEESFADLPEEERPTLQEQAFLTEAQVASLEAGWFQDFLSFDPAPYLRTLTVPLLAIYGERDLQVPPEQSEGPLRELMREANNEDATIIVFDGLNHLMQPAQTGGIEEYGVIETTMAPEVLELLAGWLSERFKDP